MPHANEFMKGFELIKNRSIAGYNLVDASCKHETIVRYHEYRYIIQLKFLNINGKYQQLIDEIEHLISKQPIVYGISNPYRCYIDKLNYRDIVNINGLIVINLLGHAIRI